MQQTIYRDEFQGNYQALLQAYNRLQQQVAERDAEIKKLRARLQWENKLLATPSEDMSDAQKVVALVLPSIIQKQQAKASTDDIHDDGSTRIYRGDVAQRTGKSPQRAGQVMKQMDQPTMLKRKVGIVRDPITKQVIDRPIMIALTDQFKRAEIKAVTPRNTGNKQKNHVMCRTCGTELVKVTKLVRGTCPTCGEVHTYDLAKKEDRAFIVKGEIAENFEETYFDFPVEEVTSVEALPVEVVDIPPVEEVAPVEEVVAIIKPVAFTDVPRNQKYPRGCHHHSAHKDRWKYTLSGLHCPICEPVWA